MNTKFKLSPQEYNSILKGIKLINIRLVEGKFKVNYYEIKGKQLAKIKEKSSYTINSDKLVVISMTYSFIGTKSEEKLSLLSIEAKYNIELDSEKEFTKDFFDIYKKINLHSISWPFFREFVNNITSRMHIKPITLPLVRTK